MDNNKIIIAIPVRLESKRLPRKVLIKIDGKSILERVYDQCKKISNHDGIVICTHDQELKKYAESLNCNVLLTSPNVESGSERLSSISNELISFAWRNEKISNSKKIENLEKKTYIINVQGDQPFIDPEVINKMINLLDIKGSKMEILTPVYKLKPNDIHDTSIVKTIVSSNSKALYFSRSAIPHVRDVDPNEWHRYFQYWGHVGIYVYRADILKDLKTLPIPKFEEAEKLEQLKFLDAGIEISTIKVTGDFLSVDTQDDLEYAKKNALIEFNK